MSESTPPRGWGFPGASKKAHYFVAGEIISLCRKWMFSGNRADDNHNSVDNCATCKKLQSARKETT